MSGRRSFYLPLLALAVKMMDASPLVSQDKPNVVPAGYDRGGRHPHQTRSVVIAKHGIVATSHPLASQAGLDILKAGGNAADAAIAANAVIGVVEPMSCGIGGDLFVIYWDAKTQKLYGLNASGRSPYKLNREVFEEKGLDADSDRRAAELVGARLRQRLGDAAGSLRHQAAGRDSGAGDRRGRERLPGAGGHRRLLAGGRAGAASDARSRGGVSDRWPAAAAAWAK